MIVRIARRDRYVTVSNDAVRDPRLSFKARGLLVFLLSMPDGWETSYRHLSKVGPDGEHAVRAALTELEGAGYLTREKRRGDGGRWEWTSTIYEAPCGGFPGTENPGQDDPGLEERRTKEEPTKEDLRGTEPSPPSVADDPRSDPSYRFEDFWQAYPMRNGKRVEKKKALDQWRKLPFEAKARAFKAAHHYAASVAAGATIAKDAYRWLRDQTFEDWEDGPAKLDAPVTAPRPEEKTGAAAAERMSLAERRRRGDVCPTCLDGPWEDPEDHLVKACPSCQVSVA